MDEPRRIGRYEVVRVLGRGGMGAVYLARDPLIERHLAIKVLAPGFDEAARARFAREARAAGRLDHENIATVFDVGEHAGEPFLAMEFVAGETLAALIRSPRPLPLAERLRLVEDACAGLAYAHRAGIVHLDVKPENLMRREDGRVKVLDFGIARVLESEQTETRHLLGTLRYMAPEQLRGTSVDLRTDVFAVGCVLYEVVAGTPAFSGELAEIVSRIEGRPPTPLTALVPHLPAALVRLTTRAMSPDPADRYDDLETLRRELAGMRAGLADATDGARLRTTALSVASRVNRGGAASADPPADASHGRGARRAWWAVPAILALGAGAAILWFDRGAPPRSSASAPAVAAVGDVALPPAPDPSSSTAPPAVSPRDAGSGATPETASTDRPARTARSVPPRESERHPAGNAKVQANTKPAVSPSPMSPPPEASASVGLPFGGVSSSDPPAPPPPPSAPTPLEGSAPPEAGTAAPGPPAGAKPLESLPPTQVPESAVRSALAAYAAAYDRRDMDALRRVFPAIPREQANALAQRFSEAVSYRLVIGPAEIVVTGSTASAVCAVTHEFVPKIGTSSRNNVRSRFHLQLTDGQWVITRIDSVGAR